MEQSVCCNYVALDPMSGYCDHCYTVFIVYSKICFVKKQCLKSESVIKHGKKLAIVAMRLPPITGLNH